MKKEENQYYLTLKGFWKRLRQEYHYYFDRPWTLTDVGNFWDSVRDYDVVNETLYTYYRRFTNSYELAVPYLPDSGYRMLDVQARSGKGSEFWYCKEKISSTVCIDFSEYLRSLAINRLKDSGVSFESVCITELPFPLNDNEFELVCSYETVEHIYNYRSFIKELSRVMSVRGIMIITCPNVAWEWVHWLTAIININHSEGPHRFIRRRKLLNAFRDSGLIVLKENSTIILPFNKRISVSANQWIESHLPEWIKRNIALRRTFILKKKSDV